MFIHIIIISILFFVSFSDTADQIWTSPGASSWKDAKESIKRNIPVAWEKPEGAYSGADF